MKVLFFIVALALLIKDAKAQYFMPNMPEADTFYYPYEDGIQMIEIALAPYIMNYDNADYMERRNLSAHNIYIFRDENGKILNIYNQKENVLDISKLQPVNKEKYSAAFLLYQFKVGNYIDANTKKSMPFFIYENEAEKYGFINQKGEIIIEAAYDYFNVNYDTWKPTVISIDGLHSKPVYGLIFLDDIDNSIESTFTYIHPFYTRSLPNSFIQTKINNDSYIINRHSNKIIFSKLKSFYSNVLNHYTIFYYNDSDGREWNIPFHSDKINKPTAPFQDPNAQERGDKMWGE